MKNNFLKSNVLFLFLILILTACDKDDNQNSQPDPISFTITNFEVQDAGNSANASDILISFNKVTDETDLDEYRAFIVKTTSSNTFNLNEAQTVNTSNYTTINKTGSNINTSLTSDALDTDGEVIIEDTSYTIFIMAVVNTNSLTFLNGLSNGIAITLTSPDPEEFSITNLMVTDASDMANASDIVIEFDKVEDETDLDEYRAFVIKTTGASAFDLNAAQVVTAANYTTISKTGSNINTSLPSDALDTDGDAIVEETSYTVFVMAVASASSTNFLNGLSNGVEITLTTPPPPNIVSNLNQGFDASGNIVIGSDGSIYVANFGTGAQNGTKILKFTPDGSSYVEFADGLLGPTGGAFNSQGELFWSSYSASKVHKIDANGNVSDFASVPGPVAIVIDDSDNLFVASCDGNEIKKITPSGTVSTFASSTMFNCINGLTTDENGNLYGCNYDEGRIFKITPSGTVTLLTTIPTNSSDNMVYKDGYLYVTARSAHRIYKVSISDGANEVFAGTGSRGNTNGAVLESQFSLPNGIRFSLDGNFIYVNDVDPNSGTNVNGVNWNPNILRKIEIVN